MQLFQKKTLECEYILCPKLSKVFCSQCRRCIFLEVCACCKNGDLENFEPLMLAFCFGCVICGINNM